MKKYAYPKNIWIVRANHENIIVKATEAQILALYEADRIEEYQPLKAEIVKA